MMQSHVDQFLMKKQIRILYLNYQFYSIKMNQCLMVFPIKIFGFICYIFCKPKRAVAAV